MEFAVIIVVLIIIGLFIYNSYSGKIKKKKLINKIINYFKNANIEHKLEINNNDIFDIDLIINEKHYLIKIVIIPAYSEIQINNKSTWEVKYGAGNTPGKVQPHKRYLNEIVNFQNNDFNGAKKVVIFSPKPKKIVKYINECEIVFVNSKTDVYGTNIISENQLAYFIKNE